MNMRSFWSYLKIELCKMERGCSLRMGPNPATRTTTYPKAIELHLPTKNNPQFQTSPAKKKSPRSNSQLEGHPVLKSWYLRLVMKMVDLLSAKSRKSLTHPRIAIKLKTLAHATSRRRKTKDKTTCSSYLQGLRFCCASYILLWPWKSISMRKRPSKIQSRRLIASKETMKSSKSLRWWSLKHWSARRPSKTKNEA